MAKRRSGARGASRIRTSLRNLGLSDEELSAADELIENVGFIEDRLFNARLEIGDAPIFETYDHGGGQRGTKKAAWVEAYSRLYASYITGLKSLLERLGDKHSAAEVAHSDVKSRLQALRDAEKKRGESGAGDGEDDQTQSGPEVA